MEVVNMDSFDMFIRYVANFSQAITVYRGVTHEDYDLRPKVGRLEKKRKNESLINLEQRILRRFEERAIPYLGIFPGEDEWEWMAIGQHHGLPTRMLDWSRNPLVAAYFAVEREILKHELKKYSGNSAIYAFKGKTVISKGNLFDINTKYKNGPFKIKKTEKFVPAHLDKRITAQSGIFTIHHDPTIKYPNEIEPLFKLTIPSNQRKIWKKRLHSLGINRASLFPDLDNLCSHIEWLCSKSY